MESVFSFRGEEISYLVALIHNHAIFGVSSINYLSVFHTYHRSIR